MSIIKIREKITSHHPWENVIRTEYSNKMKYGHNSVHNPLYPAIKEKVPDDFRVKFTIIGNRVTEEFNYCVNLVKGLYKYRWKNFDKPVIKGVTTVEWPKVWNDLKLKHGGFAFCINSQVAVLANDKFFGGEKELKELIETKYVYHIILDYYKEGVDQFSKFVNLSGRPCAYMHISINDEHTGTLIFMSTSWMLTWARQFLLSCPTEYREKWKCDVGVAQRLTLREAPSNLRLTAHGRQSSSLSDQRRLCIQFLYSLYADLVPNTCENFLRLCKTKKGGYSGTPVHRIVKDCWIQCGGYGLKSVDLDCENFIIPHDRRGVLCMANDGRHVDCSTQFFVLLQPAPWMAHKYVAFGQLIDGESTLKDIEAVPTWYESPKSEIIMYQTGILNMECQDIMINKGTNEYIQGHIEDLVILGEILYEELMVKVFLEADLRLRERLMKKDLEEISVEEEERTQNVRETQRFMRKKNEIDKQIQKSQINNRRPSSAKSQSDSRRRSSVLSEPENNEFDVEVYEYEPEEPSYKHVSLSSVSSVIKPTRPFYIALTDVPYPGDVDSTFDLKKMLRGDYCLESDLQVYNKGNVNVGHASYDSEVIRLDHSEQGSISSLASDDELEIKKYLKYNVDRISFAGSVVRSIARGIGKVNIFEDARKSELITDDELRKLRLMAGDHKPHDTQDKKVSISVPLEKKDHHKIKRRQTGFIRSEDLKNIANLNQSESSYTLQEEEESATAVRKVRIAPSAIVSQIGTKPNRRQTGFVKPMHKESDVETPRQSALSRLYDDFDVTHEEDTYGPIGPTLKDYKPLSEVQPKRMLLTYSPNARIKCDDSSREKYLSHIHSDHSYEHALSFQHGKRVARKISSDYVKTMDSMQTKGENSIRSVEFARMRPSLSVSEYQLKNQKYYAENKHVPKILTVMQPSSSFEKKKSSAGLAISGETPVYFVMNIKDHK